MFKPIHVILLLSSALAVAVAISSANAATNEVAIKPNVLMPMTGLKSIEVNASRRQPDARKGKIQLAKKWGRGRRGRWRRGHRHRHNDGINPGAAAALIIGGIILNEAFRAENRSDFERCDDRYRTFRWSDGTFQPSGGGPRKLCPYLY